MGLAIWHKGKLGVSTYCDNIEGVYFTVVEQPIDRFITRFGFIYPITSNEFNLEALLADELPPRMSTRSGFKLTSSNATYLLIDVNGRAWQYTIFVSTDEGPSYEIFSVDLRESNSGIMSSNPSERQYVQALLTADVPFEQLSQVSIEHGVGDGVNVEWISLAEIRDRVKAMQDSQPKLPTERPGRIVLR